MTIEVMIHMLMIHMLCLLLVLLICMIEICLGDMFIMCLERNIVHVSRKVMDGPSTIYHASNASFAICRKDRKIVARKLGAKCKDDKTCIWVPKTIVTNLVGPNKSVTP